MTFVASFDGTNDLAQVADSTPLRTPSTALTVAGWVYRHGTGQDYGTMFSKAKTPSPPYGSYAAYQNSFQTGRYHAYVSSATTQYDTAAQSPTLALNTWYFVALTWASGSGCRFRVWDTTGSLIHTGTGTTYTGSLGYSADPFYLGGFPGEVSALRMGCWGVHDAVLTDAQLITNADSWFNTGRPPTVLSGYFWDLENTWANNTTYGASGSGTLSPQNGATFIDAAVPWTVPSDADEYAGALAAASGAASADFAGTYAPPEYAGSLAAASGSASATLSGEYQSPPVGALAASAGAASVSLAGTYTTPEYIGALGASSGAGSGEFAGTYEAPGYSGDLSATSGGSSAGFAGTYAAPEYDGDFAAGSGVASVSFSGAYTAPSSGGSLSAASQPATASFSGTYTLPVYEGSLSAGSGPASASISGDYTPPPGGVLSVTSGPASAEFSGSYAVPVYDGDFAAIAGGAEVAFAGSYAVPVYVGSFAAVSGPATGGFTEDPPIIAHYLTGRLSVRPTLRGSLTVSPALTGTLNLEPA